MREARCETPGMYIPLLGGYRSSKKLADLWQEYSLSSTVSLTGPKVLNKKMKTNLNCNLATSNNNTLY